MSKGTGTNGRRKLARFLKKNEITYQAAADALGVSKPMVHDYVHGKKRPGDKMRARIELWTGGSVIAADWMLAKERRAARIEREVQPFEPGGT